MIPRRYTCRRCGGNLAARSMWRSDAGWHCKDRAACMERAADKLIGKRVELVRCTDPHTRLAPGQRGTVTFVDDEGTVFVDWDSGSRLGLLPRVDSYTLIEGGT